MSTGNKHQSEWSQDFHAKRGDTTLPCPAADLGGHPGLCKDAHPRGIVLLASGGWKSVPPIDLDAYIPRTRDAHDL